MIDIGTKKHPCQFMHATEDCGQKQKKIYSFLMPPKLANLEKNVVKTNIIVDAHADFNEYRFNPWIDD